MVLVYYGFSTYKFRGEGSPYEVEEIITYLIIMCDDDPSVSAAKSVTYRKLLRVNITFFWLGEVTAIRRIAITDLEPNIEYRLGLNSYNRIRTHLSQHNIRIFCVDAQVMLVTP